MSDRWTSEWKPLLNTDFSAASVPEMTTHRLVPQQYFLNILPCTNICFYRQNLAHSDFFISTVKNILAWANSRHLAMLPLVCPAKWPRSGKCFSLVESNFPCDTTNQEHYPDLGSDASSVWNFGARFRRHVVGKPVVVSPNVSCFLRPDSWFLSKIFKKISFKKF